MAGIMKKKDYDSHFAVQYSRISTETAMHNIQMLEWALDVTKDSTGDLLELYCGNGNFSLALGKIS